MDVRRLRPGVYRVSIAREDSKMRMLSANGLSAGSSVVFLIKIVSENHLPTSVSASPLSRLSRLSRFFFQFASNSGIRTLRDSGIAIQHIKEIYVRTVDI